jgi:hypothetical protein
MEVKVIDRIYGILVEAGAREPTEAEATAYRDTLDWTNPIHFAKWNGEKFTEVDNELEG